MCVYAYAHVCINTEIIYEITYRLAYGYTKYVIPLP